MIDYLQKFRLDKKTAFVVGGLGLIGREVSTAFTMAGAKFTNEMYSKGYEINYISFDCANMQQIDNNFTKILKEYGVPDVFINCSYPRTEDWGESSFKKISMKSFRKNVDIHMNSFSWLARLVAEAMVKENKNGSIIQIGSMYGMIGQDLSVYEGTKINENMAYAAIKGGIINLTRQMSSYYGQFNIRINTICPGGLQGHMAGISTIQDKKFVDQFNKKVPLKRMGRADEIAPTALLLASDASSYITGSTIMIDGGWTVI